LICVKISCAVLFLFITYIQIIA
jgi:hypothetical protein